jgi:hypothetical protein
MCRGFQVGGEYGLAPIYRKHEVVKTVEKGSTMATDMNEETDRSTYIQG